MSRPSRPALLILGVVLLVVSSLAAQDKTQLVSGTTIQVEIGRDVSMKVGEPVKAQTLYPVYVDNQLVLPKGSELLGRIVSLSPAPRRIRLDAHMGGDFTHLHEAQIQFDELDLPGATPVPIRTISVGGGVQVVRFVTLGAGALHPSLTRKLWTEAVGKEKEAVQTFTAPRKMDRVRRLLYSELPYHPELLIAGTMYSVEIADPITLPLATGKKPDQPEPGVDATVRIDAALLDEISSKTAVPGSKIHAVVTEPLFNADHKLQVPQGSVLMGEVTQARPAGKWGKGGTLRFSFRELQFPKGFTQKVHGAPTAVDADQNANLQIDTEGGVKPGPKGIAAPLAMTLLAASALHEDEASVLHTGGASNGFALIGRVISLATKSPYVGAAFGFYGAGRSIHKRFIAHGADVTFLKHTRIEVVLDPERTNALSAPVPIQQ